MAKGLQKTNTNSIFITTDKSPRIKTSNGERILNIIADAPDLRDQIYAPGLLMLQKEYGPPVAGESVILNQGAEGACTGFALAAIVNLLRRRQADQADDTPPESVSPRMFYEMAKIHDEWPGEDYEGSSIRGALKGFFNNGVCSETLAPYRVNDNNWNLKVAQARDARKVGLGAYYRLRPVLIDYHAALNEVGAIYVSASVHRGWTNPSGGVIKKSSVHEGGHAFAIVGYDADGFLIQNSWGGQWGGFGGNPGIAHWSYGDWAENVMDAWVLRLAVPTPSAFDLTHAPVKKESADSAKAITKPVPRRSDILGHFIHIDDGNLVENGRYGSDLTSLRQTAKFLEEDANKPTRKYDHLMLYAHGGLNSSDDSARRIAAMKEVYKRNGIYPVHFMWETGFSEESTDILKEIFRRGDERVGSIGDFRDRLIEKLARGVGKRLWAQMKLDAERAFDTQKSGYKAVKLLLASNAASSKPRPVHLVGHSAGSIFLGEFLGKLAQMTNADQKISSVSLMAPACTLDVYETQYRPKLIGNAKARTIGKLSQYNLVDSREQDDTVAVYGKSLLYFVSNAFETVERAPLLGMEKFSEHLILPAVHEIKYAGRHNSHTNSRTHGGFDNDRATMNAVLTNILGQKPPRAKAFQQSELEGY
jgi:hypothetical protein